MQPEVVEELPQPSQPVEIETVEEVVAAPVTEVALPTQELFEANEEFAMQPVEETSMQSQDADEVVETLMPETVEETKPVVKTDDELDTNKFKVANKSKGKAQKGEKMPNTRKRIVPFILGFVFLLITAFFGYLLYIGANSIGATADNFIAQIFVAIFSTLGTLFVAVPAVISTLITFIMFSLTIKSKYIPIKVIGLILAIGILIGATIYGLYVVDKLNIVINW